MDEHTALFCQYGRFVPGTCSGARGCRPMAGEHVACDLSGSDRGDDCPEHYQGVEACRPDKKAKVVCTDGKIAHVPCRGPLGCVSYAGDNGADKVKTCDNTVVPLGVPCALGEITAGACSDDLKAVVACTDGKTQVLRACRGPKGCKPKGDGVSVDCDTSIVAVGDPCDHAFEGCSEGAQITCGDDERVVVRQRCPGQDGCVVREGRVLCDGGFAEVGDACVTEGRRACAFDRSSLLVCKGGVMQLDRACKAKDGCAFTAPSTFDCPAKS